MTSSVNLSFCCLSSAQSTISKIPSSCLSRASGLNDFTAWRRKSHKSLSTAATGIGRLMGAVCSDQKAGIASGDAQGKINYSSISDEEWKKRLSKDQYNIARKKGTERAFTGEYWNTKTLGVYHCICCDTPLFDSNTKFDSGTGWPSYYEPIGNNVKSKMDFSIIFMPREEVLCAVCDAHLGHVFDDGPPPTGKRYCINSASLKLRPK